MIFLLRSFSLVMWVLVSVARLAGGPRRRQRPRCPSRVTLVAARSPLRRRGPGRAASTRRRSDEQLARARERAVALELAQRLLDLAPGFLAPAGVETRHHLVERAERFALEAHALGRRDGLERRRDCAHLDVAEARVLERLLQDAGPSQAEGTRLSRRGGSQIRATPDDAHGDREELVALGRRVNYGAEPAPRLERALHARERPPPPAEVAEAHPRHDGVEAGLGHVEVLAVEGARLHPQPRGA